MRRDGRGLDPRDDMGVVIERAFQIVSQRDAYEQSMKEEAAYENRVAKNQVDMTKTNPVRQEMSRALDYARESVRERFQKELLTNSVRQAAK
jgi:hypothetical protein